MAMVKNTIPKPPIHCISDRQNSRAWGRDSTSLMTVTPVVVKPDMVSKKASVILGNAPDSRKGSMPNKLNTIHVIVTTT